MTTVKRPNLQHELSRLKDFQRDTVEYVYSRMYDSAAPSRRFLVADEVGLGKTMVARGVVAKVVDRLWDDVDRIDVIYICSNGSIARQNINRLNITEAKDASLPSRITLLPTVVHGLKERKLNFISLTPQTSFDLKSSLGRFEERALLYWLLPEAWKKDESAVRNLLQGEAGRDAFRRRVAEFEHEHIDEGLRSEFHKQLEKHPDLHAEFISTADRFQTWRKDLPPDDRSAQRALVGRLRLELAISCLGALEPDLIILDEFQRFKHLLDGTDRAGDLARELFDFGDARVLLLSATPYKMYTMADEAESDDHFSDFLQTVTFLQKDSERTEGFRKSLEAYRNGIFAASTAEDTEELVEAKQRVEAELRLVMVRTERLAVSADRNGMLAEVPADVTLTDHDVLSYLGLAQVAVTLDQPDITEFWKSAPYLLNFMDEYQFKSQFREALADPKQAPALSRILSECSSALITWDDVERYKALDPANARLRHIVAELHGSDAWRLLWLPPSLPYYEMSGPFAGRENRQLTKRLIFSSWQVVPKVVSAVLSYEAERLMFGPLNGDERPNTAEGRERFRPLLRFARSDGRTTAMALLSLLYPSVSLAELGDPLELRRGLGPEDAKLPIEDLLKTIERSSSAGVREAGECPDASRSP